FVDYVITQVQDLIKDHYGGVDAAQNAIFVDGLKVFTTLDPDTQASAEKAINDLMAEYQSKAQNGTYLRQAATVVMDPATGHIAAMVGGRGYDPEVSRAWNRATQTVRQPGSSIKPLVDYAPAIAKRVITAATVFDDVPTAFPGNWKPTDFDNNYYGLISIREAIFRSQNITAIKTLQALGVDNGIDFLRKLGITTIETTGPKNDRNLSLAIGGITKGISVIELTQAYGALANGGVKVQPTAIREIQDRYGRTIYKAQPAKTAVMDEQTAYITTDLLKSVISDPRGTGYRGQLNRPAAGKSGTTDDWADAWFVGYTPDFVTTVWVGHDQPTPMNDLYGKGLPLRIWQQIMLTAHRNRPVRDWSRPANLVDQEICTVSGKRPSSICPKDKISKEVFIKGTEPKTTDICDVHVQARVDKATGLPATPTTPPDQVETKVFIKRPQPLVYPLPYGNPPADAKDELPVKFAEQLQPTTGTGGSSVPNQPTNPTNPSTSVPTTPTNPSAPPTPQDPTTPTTKPGNGNGGTNKPPSKPN
ncbi:MAG: transglycosylase domain-containing protein, partial [Bacillota bacterium]